MEPMPEAIRVIEDKEHFLVIIPPKQRERAKAIAGRSWDPDKRAWVYAKTIETFEALEKEFKGDAAEFSLTQTGCSLPAQKVSEPSTDQVSLERFNSLDKRMIGLDEKLKQLTESAAEHQEALSSQFEMIAEWRKKNEENEEIINEKVTLDHFDQMLKTLLIGELPEDSDLVVIFKENHLINDYNYVVNRLEEALKSRIRSYLDLDDTRIPLNQLIHELDEADSIDRETMGYLKNFRSIRNRSVHEAEESKTRRLQRYLACTLSLTLAWPAMSTPSREP